MLIRDTQTGEDHEAVIELVTEQDFKVIKKSPERFRFEWNKYKGQEDVYKLRLKKSNTILGLMHLIDHKDVDTNAIEIELLEVSSENVGLNKRLENIGGCLIAYACRESFKRGHDGCVFLTPKGYLIKHYQERYGFYHLELKTQSRPHGLMIAYKSISNILIKAYLG